MFGSSVRRYFNGSNLSKRVQLHCDSTRYAVLCVASPCPSQAFLASFRPFSIELRIQCQMWRASWRNSKFPWRHLAMNSFQLCSHRAITFCFSAAAKPLYSILSFKLSDNARDYFCLESFKSIARAPHAHTHTSARTAAPLPTSPILFHFNFRTADLHRNAQFWNTVENLRWHEYV